MVAHHLSKIMFKQHVIETQEHQECIALIVHVFSCFENSIFLSNGIFYPNLTIAKQLIDKEIDKEHLLKTLISNESIVDYVLSISHIHT